MKRTVLISIFISILIGILGYIFYDSKNEYLEQKSLYPKYYLTHEEYKEIKDRLITTLNTQSPQAALGELRILLKNNSALERSCHALTHELGHFSYEKYKSFNDALLYSDEICGSGYLHGIIESHFSNVSDLALAVKSVCTEPPTESFKSFTCYHGVGHGLMYSTSNDLTNSLEMCSSFRDPLAKRECTGGVFMENFITDQKSHPSTFLNPSDPFYPCQNISDNNKQQCYLYAPMYFLTLYKNEYVQALKWCNEAENSFKSACATGVGIHAIKGNYANPLYIEAICMEGENEQVQPCISGMIGSIIGQYGSLEEAHALCSKLKEDNQNSCKEVVKDLSLLF